MFKLLTFASLLLLAHAYVRPKTHTPKLDSRIIGGMPADISEAPYQVALLLDMYNIGLHYLACGGSIITENVVISSAHCVDDSKDTQWLIRAGSTFTAFGGQARTVSEIVIHPDFEKYILDYDICLIFLSSPLIINGGSTALVPLPAQGQDIDDGANAFVTGWGSNEEGDNTADTLWQVTTPIVNQDVCKNIYSSLLYPVTDRMFCAGNVELGGQNVCTGDFGGPLTIDGVLIGISSWGFGCARPGYPSVWTRVSYFRNWIDSELGS